MSRYVQTRNAPLLFFSARVIAEDEQFTIVERFDGRGRIRLQRNQIKEDIPESVARDLFDMVLAEHEFEKWQMRTYPRSPSP